MHITTQRLTTHHLALFLELLRVYEAAFDMQDFQLPEKYYLKNLLNNQDLIIYTAMHDGAVIGGLTAHVLPSCPSAGSEVYIFDFAVQPAFQRKGVGRQLLTAFTAYCRENNYRSCFVQALTEDAHAVDFYRAIGGNPEQVMHFTFETPANK